MALFLNMERSLLRKGGRKAPEISMTDFQYLFKQGCARFKEETDGTPDFRLDNEFGGVDIMLYDALSEFPGEAPFGKLAGDLKKVNVDWENICAVKYVVGTNNIPAFMCIIGGDWEVPVVFFLYWDGKTFRAYIPVYGNSYNRYCKSAIGSEDPDLGNMYRKYHVVCGRCENDCGDELFEDGQAMTPGQELDVQITEANFETFRWHNVAYNEAACLEDFSSRVVSTGPVAAERVEKWKNAMDALAAKNVWAELDDEDGQADESPANDDFCSQYQPNLYSGIHAEEVSDPSELSLLMRWEDGCVVFDPPYPCGPVDDDLLLAKISGLEKVAEHRFRYQCHMKMEEHHKALAKVDGMRPLMEILLLYGPSLGIGIDKYLIRGLIMDAVEEGKVTLDELSLR